MEARTALPGSLLGKDGNGEVQGKILMTHPTKAITWSLLADFVRVSRNSVDEGLYTEQVFRSGAHCF